MASASAVVTLLVAVLAVLSTLVVTVRWVWDQGKKQERQTSAIVRNTEATSELSEKFGLYVDKANGNLLEHERRITRIEAIIKH